MEEEDIAQKGRKQRLFCLQRNHRAWSESQTCSSVVVYMLPKYVPASRSSLTETRVSWSGNEMTLPYLNVRSSLLVVALLCLMCPLPYQVLNTWLRLWRLLHGCHRLQPHMSFFHLQSSP